VSESNKGPFYNRILVIAVVQAQDAEIAKETLNKLGMTVERLPSVGGFLGRRNATLMIGMPEEQREQAIEALPTRDRARPGSRS